MNDSRYDVLIVGARCAGAATAMLLARRGLRVLAIDRGQYGSDALSTHALMRGAVIHLDRWGLLDRIREAGTPTVRTTTFHYGERPEIAIDIRPRHGVGALYAPRRTVLDRTLVDAARAAGAQVEFGTRLLSLVRDRHGRVVGARTSRAGVARDIYADRVIGADGVRSTVASAVGARPVKRALNTTSTIFAYVSGLEDRGYHWYYQRNLGAGAIPTNGGHCVFVAMPPARLRSAGLDVEACFRECLAEAAPALSAEMDGASLDGAFRRAFGVPGHMRESHGPGWALVGDAGYFKDPITAHGITDALRDAELLAHAISQGTDAALTHYQQLRDSLSAELFEVTDRIASFDWDLDTLPELHRSLSLAMRREVDALFQPQICAA